MTSQIVFLLLGLAVLTAGAEALVRGACALARRAGVSPLVVGLTVVAFGTSAPELAVSVKAALSGQSDIAMGNVVGSNIFNVAVILGLAALICPLTVQLKVIRVDMPIMLVAAGILIVFFESGTGIARWEGLLLVAALGAYTVWSIVMAKREGATGDPSGTAQEVAPRHGMLLVQILLVIGGLVLLVVGAGVFVENASALARQLGWSEATIGLTIVAAGTSLPELATSLVAALRRETDIAVGDIVGSNIFNALGIAGTAAVVSPIMAGGIGWLDLGTMLVASVLLLPFMRSGFRLVRWEGAVLLACYGAYLWAIWPS